VAVGPRGKPGAGNGGSISELMAQLGVTSWTQVPNPILERWMEADQPPRLRVMAALVRHSFGYQRPYAVHLVKGKERPLQQADLSRLLGIAQRWMKRVLAKVESQGLIRGDGKLLYPVATPPEMGVKLTLPAFSSPFAFSSPQDQLLLDDPEYAKEVAEIKSDYLRELGQAKGRMTRRLEIAKARAAERAKGVNLTPIPAPALEAPMGVNLAPVLGVDLTPKAESPPHPLLREKKESKAGRQAVHSVTEESAPAAGPPACPALSAEQAELSDYLKGFAGVLGTAPDPGEVIEIHARLRAASIGQFRTHVENRLARGFRPRGWRVFQKLAADCAAGQEAFAAAGALPAAEDKQQQKIRRLRRALAPKGGV